MNITGNTVFIPGSTSGIGLALAVALQDRGNTVIIGPEGELLAGPLIGEEGVLYAEIDAGRARSSRQQFDPVGHYNRADIFRLCVDTSPRPAVIDTPGPFSPQVMATGPDAGPGYEGE